MLCTSPSTITRTQPRRSVTNTRAGLRRRRARPRRQRERPERHERRRGRGRRDHREGQQQSETRGAQHRRQPLTRATRASVWTLPAASTACTRNATRSEARRRSARRTARAPRAVSRNADHARAAPRPATPRRPERRDAADPAADRRPAGLVGAQRERQPPQPPHAAQPVTRADTRQARVSLAGGGVPGGRRRRGRARRRRAVDEPVHRPVQRDDEQPPARVLAERAQVRRTDSPMAASPAGLGEVDRAQLAHAVVARRGSGRAASAGRDRARRSRR